MSSKTSSRSDEAPDDERAWTGDMDELVKTLESLAVDEADLAHGAGQESPYPWAWRWLSRGGVASCRVVGKGPEMRLQHRLSIPKKAVTLKQKEAWGRAVDRYEEAAGLGAPGYARMEQPDDMEDQGSAAYWTEHVQPKGAEE